MRRREFIAFVGSTAVAARPPMARAQQSKAKPMRRVAMLMP
jgi:hypothetical protein